jgi:glycosyltransferase involved in cell wall biosynthesis
LVRKKIKIVVTVISDLVTDQRVHKVCTALNKAGYEVVLIGAKRKNSLPLSKRIYKTNRIQLLFQKKFLFYAEFNIRLFFKLLFTNADVYLGNDLDVMPATFLAGRIKRKPVVYDTHEYYMGMPELNGKPTIKKVWHRIERFIFPRLNHIYTICESFCALYYKDYQKKLQYILNVPFLEKPTTEKNRCLAEELIQKIPADKFILLFQGAGINPERGVEELVASMSHLDPQKFHLLIIGGGDIFEKIRMQIKENDLADRISLIPKVPFEVLHHITSKANLGLTLDKPTNINHIYGLPNKIFDYIHAGLPVLSSRLVELEKIIQKHNVGTFIENHDPYHIAEAIREIAQDEERLAEWKRNTLNAKHEYNWEREERKLLHIYSKVCKDAGLINE